MSKAIKFQRVMMVIAASSTPGLKPSVDVELDRNYSKCIGLGVAEISNGGLSRYDIAVKDEAGRRELLELHDKSFYVTNSDVDVNKRFRDDVNMPITGEKISLQVETFAPTTSDLVLQFVFKLQK